ncbi:hypothetical protein [Maribacter aquivivus]|uniref:hypothetical protein n=1 Tax=Maribacter aquivivus TaxID=228958 RepID=UPI0024942C38|nr:hypothetical protein [Maribacter aquivivus]
MNQRDLIRIESLLKRTEDLPEILHLRAHPVDYKHTEEDKEFNQELVVPIKSNKRIIREVTIGLTITVVGGLILWMITNIFL